MTEAELIERIREGMRDAVADVVPPADLVSRVGPPRMSRWRVRRDALVPALGALVAVAVAVVALTSLTHRSGGGGGAAGRVPAAARGLVARLSVLRRPQTAADRLPAWAAAQALDYPGHGRLEPGLSRLVASVATPRYGVVRVYLVVTTPQRYARRPDAVPTPLLSPRLGDQAAVVLVVGRHASRVTRGEPASTLCCAAMEDLPRGYAQGGPGDLRRAFGVGASIVPDGVPHVRWAFPEPAGPRARAEALLMIEPRQNVAAAALGSGFGPLRSAEWIDGSNHVMERFPANVAQPAAAAHFGVLRSAAARARMPRWLAAIVRGNGYGIDPRQARLVTYPRAGHLVSVWVVPGSSGVALAVASTRFAASTGVAGALAGTFRDPTIYADGSQTVIGLVPDGNRSVTAVLPGGRRITAPVVDNVYEIHVPGVRGYLVVRDWLGRPVRIGLGSR
jgi:hypothetical protein